MLTSTDVLAAAGALLPLAPWAGVAAVLAVLGVALGALRMVQVRYRPRPEPVRKALHVLMGGVALGFPWLFGAAWPVAVLAALATGAMAALRLAAPLRRALGPVLHAVGRASVGELCFAPAVATTFALTGGDPVRYGIPVLLLTLADPAAALVGQRWGRARYRTPDGAKSFRGSAACFFVAFACTHVPLLLSTTTGHLESLLLAALVGVAVTLVEAAAWRGLDNLFVPLSGLAALHIGLPLSAPALAVTLAVVGALAGLAVLWLRRAETAGHALTSSAAAGAVLAGAAAWWMGGGAALVALAVCCLGATRGAASARGAVRLALAVAVAGACAATLSAGVGAAAWAYGYALAGLAAGALMLGRRGAEHHPRRLAPAP